jgi:hypothetical protein
MDLLELRAQELAAYQAWCRMPPALRCAFCDAKAGPLPQPPSRFTPFDALRVGDRVMMAGRYGMFLCADCIHGAWGALQQNGGSA